MLFGSHPKMSSLMTSYEAFMAMSRAPPRLLKARKRRVALATTMLGPCDSEALGFSTEDHALHSERSEPGAF